MTLQLNKDMSILDRNLLESDNESDSDEEIDLKTNISIKNPFFSREKIIVNDSFYKIIDMNNKELRYNFNKIYIICLKNNGKINDTFYQETITTTDLDDFMKNLTLIEGNIKMIYNQIHKSSCVLTDKCYLYLFKTNTVFDDKELVLPLINLTEDDARLYVKQYSGMFSMEEYFKSKVINNFYQNKDSHVCNFNTNLLTMLEESSYWSKNFNTQLNITNKFINRGFNLSLSQRIKDSNLKTILQEVNDIPREGDEYLGFLYKKKTYIDISSIIKKNGYTLYRISDSDYDLNKDKFEFILQNTVNNYELYKIFCNLLISKDYCHLVLNDSSMLDNINGSIYDKRYAPVNLFKKYNLAFKYAIGYSWLTFYIEESVKKTRIVDDDRFVFSINTANKLPSFPVIYEDISQNPYLPMLISKDVLDISNNCIGVRAYKGEYGVVTFDQFVKNLNVFLTGDESRDIMENINWDNIAISGSILPACVTKFNPLETLFPNKNRYFQEYYATSDVDVMCNIQNNFKYIDKAYQFYTTIKDNFMKISKSKSENNISLKTIKTAAIIANETFIRKNIVKKCTKFTFEYIFTHLDDPEIKQIFYSYYVEWKLKENEKYINTPEWKNEKYSYFFDIIPKEDIVVIFARTKNDWNKYWSSVKSSSENKDDIDDFNKDYFTSNDKEEESEDDIDDSNILFNCFENLKFKIESKYLNHNFEFFKTKYDGSFFSTVSQFHLPCVRGFYDGKDVKLLPSCITAAMTLINMDYKYFAGTKDPIEIINKYRMRGYSTILNDSERVRLVSYSNKVEKWNKLYGSINGSDSCSISNVFGCKEVSDDFFKPRRILKELFVNNLPVSNEYLTPNLIPYDINNESYGLCFENYKHATKSMKNLYTINKYGYVNKVQKWYFDYIYENF